MNPSLKLFFCLVASLLILTISACSSSAPAASSTTPMTHAQRAAAATKAMEASYAVAIPSQPEFLTMLQNKQFQQIEKLSTEFRKNIPEKPETESAFLRLFAHVDDANDDIGAAIDEWIKQSPKSSTALTLRARFLISKGWQARGTAYRSKTPDENIAQFQDFLKLAHDDLMQAVIADEQFLPAYCFLLQIARDIGNQDMAVAIYGKALPTMQSSYFLRHFMMGTLFPKWGGSYAQMQLFALGVTDQLLDANPRLFLLFAAVSGERASDASIANDFEESIKLYTEALAYGDRPEYLKWRGFAYYKLSRFDEAAADFRQFLKYLPTDRDVVMRLNAALSHRPPSPVPPKNSNDETNTTTPRTSL